MSNNMSLKANSTPFGVQIPIFLAGHSGRGVGGRQGMFPDPLVNGGLNPLSWPLATYDKIDSSLQTTETLVQDAYM